MVEEREFRDVMGRYATGVTVVAAADGEGRPYGLTANSLASVSLRPPLVLVCVDRSASSHDPILEADAFAVSVLRTGSEEVAIRFAANESDHRFPGVAYETRATGSPILTDALAWLDCRIWDTISAGDHTIVIGEVVECGARDGTPLVFYGGSFRRPTW